MTQNQSEEGMDERPMTADEMKAHRKKMTETDVGRQFDMIESFWAQDGFLMRLINTHIQPLKRMNTEQSVDTQPTTTRRRQPCRSANMGPPDCACSSEEEQWVRAIGLISETSDHFVEARDSRACWDLLAKLFKFQFFDLLKIPAPYTLQGRQGKETANKTRLAQSLPEEALIELRECEETLKVHSDLVEAHKAAARVASKRKALIYSEAELTAKETKLEKERQALNLKRRRTEAEASAVQNNHITDRQEIPRAHTGVSGLARQIPANQLGTAKEIPRAYAEASGSTRQVSTEPLVTARRQLLSRAYGSEPPKVRQGLVSAGTNPDKGKQLKVPLGISPLLKQVSEELSTLTGVNVVPGEDFSVTPNVPKRRTRVSRVVPPAQSVIDGLWVPDRGTIRPQLSQEELDVTKPPFTIDGKTLHPVVERIDRAVISQLIDHGLLVPRREVNLEGPQATTSEQAEPSQAEAIGEAVRPASSAKPPTEPASETDLTDDEIIIELLKLGTPKRAKIKKEGRPKKTAKARKGKARRTPKPLKNPSLGDSQDDLFGSVSEDEDSLLSSPKAGPVTLPTPEPEPIEVDPVELEIHPTRAELLCEDADKIIFNKF
ncbi:hypothetical protein DAPPUDRAFT_115844 [Daphnia pulex]|uniref:Uncharacterized protein n=1 Tax=Daphnia pulex TaxID=6669 RepID=E9HMR8_DAPPU|nr:hypothetical protein DAPPUDRAFT_115844 [Daphnia pulex]|eukprot:EFX66979.1 hypothetical protein DAPPUDRAFT_115844 [Daphnia pulex]